LYVGGREREAAFSADTGEVRAYTMEASSLPPDTPCHGGAAPETVQYDHGELLANIQQANNHE